MTQHCPKTCNRCGQVPAEPCVDKGPDCRTRSYLCTNPYYVTFMARECPVSCGKCQGTIGVGPGGGTGVVAPVVVGPGTGIGVVACSDKGTDCPKVPHLCNNNL
ncbi:hypothetical protein AAVH_16135 [Aphelenchoides avenae]|nr:hypothetical protein AAVH_16135 [Aphelenchus avenae]